MNHKQNSKNINILLYYKNIPIDYYIGVSKHSTVYKESYVICFVYCSWGDLKRKSSIFYLKNKFFFRLTTVLPADKSNAPPAVTAVQASGKT